MNTSIASFLLSVSKIVEKNNAIYRQRLDRISLAYQESNEMIAPNEDCKGRFHAPCHGYRIPQIVLDFFDFTACYEEKLFSQGEFLPSPINDEYSWFGNYSTSQFKRKTKILIKNDDISKLKEMNQEKLPFTIGFGQTWIKGEDTFCYAYVASCWKSIIDLFNSFLFEKKEVAPVIVKGNAPIGEKITVQAKVIGLPVRVNGYNQTVLKLMMVFENGATAFGTLPKKIIDVSIGDTVEITATFYCNGDKTHAFYSSPSKPKILSHVEDLDDESVAA